MGRVWICNADVESEWSTPMNAEVPQKGIRQIIFNYFEEILLSSVDSSSFAILRKEPNSEFIDYLKSLGIELPTILVAGENSAKPWLPTSQLAAQNTSLINILAKQVSEGKVDTLESFGVSKNIEKIAELSSLSISNSGSELSKSISHKSFSRTIAKKLKMHIPDGEVGIDLKNIIEAVENVRSRNKGSPIVIKPELGAAGRGQLLIKRQEDIDRLITSINHGNSGTLETTFVVERWHPNATTLSYEFHINRDGHVSTAILPRESLMDEYGRDYGYVYPAKIGDKCLNEIKRASNVLGTELWKEYQYHGPVRCDALLLPDGSLFPVLELNARHSFFYFIDTLHKKLSNQPVGLFCWFFFRYPGQIKFAQFIEDIIGKDLMFTPDKQEGAVVPIWGTVTAAESIVEMNGDCPLRRLFVLILSNTKHKAQKIGHALQKSLVAYYNCEKLDR
jgi:hypothetical protein